MAAVGSRATSSSGARRAVATAAAVLAGWAVLLGSAGAAHAAVAFRSAASSASSTSGSSNALALTIPKPAGLAVDDVMIASAQWVVKTANGSTMSASPPAGWTEVGDNDQTAFAVVLWWKRATAADVAATGFTFTGSFTNRQAIASGVISAFTGAVRTGSPLAWGPVMRIGFGGYPNYAGATIGNGQFGFARPGDTSYGAPNAAPTPGSLGVVTGLVTGADSTSQVDLSSTAGGTLAAAQPATGGGGTDGINTAIAYAAPDASGAYVDPYLQLTFSRAVDRTAFSLVLEPTPCGAGGRSLAAPPVSFPSTALTGTDGAASTTTALTVDDQTEDGTTSAGWNVTLQPTQFTNGSSTLPASALRLTSAAHADAGGRCAAPTSSATGTPLAVPAGVPTKVFNAAAGSGRGASTISLGFTLAIPANARIGSYASTWTYTLSSGP